MASRIASDAELAPTFPSLHDRSHGQSFLELLQARCATAGLYVMDGPESALSFQGQLQLLRLIHDGVRSGAQFMIATHSPILMRVDSARIYQLGGDGTEVLDDDDLAAVALWRRFLDDPDSLLDILYSDKN